MHILSKKRKGNIFGISYVNVQIPVLRLPILDEISEGKEAQGCVGADRRSMQVLVLCFVHSFSMYE